MSKNTSSRLSSPTTSAVGPQARSFPLLDDGHLVAHFLHHFQHMARKEDGRPAFGQLAQHLLHMERRLRVQPHEGLVQHQQHRLVHERADEHELLAHAMRIRRHQVAERRGEAQPVGIRLDALAPHVGRHRVKVGDVVQVLDARKEFVDVRIVGHVRRDALARERVRPHRLPRNADVALVEPGHAHDGADERRLARAVVPDEPEDVTRHDLQRHAVDRPLRPERLHDVLHHQNRRGHVARASVSLRRRFRLSHCRALVHA